MVEIEDYIMETEGKKLDGITWELYGVIYKMVRTHQTENISYYVELA